MFIKLTNAGRSATPVYIRASSITLVGEDEDGDTLVVYGDRNEFVKESPEAVLDMIKRDACWEGR